MSLENLNPEEKEQLKKLLSKAGINFPFKETSNPGPDPDDPPEERYELGPRIIEPDLWVEDWETGVKAKARKWKQRALRPKKGPITAGRSDAAEAKYADVMSTVIDQKRRQKGLAAWTDEEWGNTIIATSPDEYMRGATKKAYKMRRKIEAQHALRIYACEKLDAMPVGTKEERNAKMIANLETMRIIGEFMKGVITETEARSRIDAATR